MSPYEDYCGDALMYHLHYDPTTPFHSTGYSRVIAVSDYVANSWRRNCLNPVTDVRVTRNGIDVSKFQRGFTEDDRKAIRARFGFAPDDFVALYCGRIIDSLVDALRKLNGDSRDWNRCRRRRCCIRGNLRKNPFIGNPWRR